MSWAASGFALLLFVLGYFGGRTDERLRTLKKNCKVLDERLVTIHTDNVEHRMISPLSGKVLSDPTHWPRA